MTGELRRDAETQEYSREESHVTTEVKIGVMLPQAKECQEPPEAGLEKVPETTKRSRRNT